MNPDGCARCGRVAPRCVCDLVIPRETRHRVLVLQHPREPDIDLGTARLAAVALPKAKVAVGLSWPNLKVATGDPEVAPARWCVLYLGSARPLRGGPSVQPVDKAGAPLAEEAAAAVRSNLDGIVVLDGTWAQAKALWWRNAWLLKLKRAVLQPPRRSLYGRRRREPRRECLSTIESIGVALSGLGEDPAVEEGLLDAFARMLEAYDR